MIDHRSPPPEAEACLCRRYASSQKGGTVIAEGVSSLGEHRRRLADPDEYRPDSCPTCGWPRMHAHDFRPRKLEADVEAPATLVRRYQCAREDCGAVWQVLPELIARHLWRSWRVVERAVLSGRRRLPPVPERTRRRWRARLRASARALVVVLASAVATVWERLAREIGLGPTRRQLVVAYAELIRCEEGTELSSLAALVHRLAPGVRVM